MNKRAGIIVASAILILYGVVAFAQDAVKMYTMFPVTDEAGAAKCGAAGGTGAILYKLDANGGVIEQGGAACILEVK